MLLIFSIGIGGTTTTPEDVAQQADALGISIYPVLTHSKMVSPAQKQGFQGLFEERLGRLAKLTGGQPFIPPLDQDEGALMAGELSQILAGVRNEGLTQYVIGFVPQPPSGTPRKHTLEIKLTAKSGGRLSGGKRQAVY